MTRLVILSRGYRVPLCKGAHFRRRNAGGVESQFSLPFVRGGQVG